MTNSDHSGEPATNQDARAAFAQEAMTRWVDVGETLTLPEADQHYKVIGHRLWRASADREHTVFLIMEGACFVCGEPFSFETALSLKYLPRTCPEHHHHAALRPVVVKPEPRPRPAPVRDVVLDTLGSYALVGDRVPMAEAVQAMISKMPRRDTARDLRRQDVQRVIKRLHNAGTLGCRIDGGYFVF